MAFSVIGLGVKHAIMDNLALALRPLKALTQVEDILILILSWHLWENGHPYIHKWERIQIW